MNELLIAADTALLRAIFNLPHPPWLVAVFAASSVAGIGGALWIAIGAALVVGRRIRWREAGALVLAIALVHLVVDVAMKPLVDRARPPLTLTDLEAAVAVPESRSFPSGHAANAIAGAFVLAGIWRRARVGVWAAAALVAVARVYLGIHYPFDALAGAMTGLACGWITWRVCRLHTSAGTDAQAPRAP